MSRRKRPKPVHHATDFGLDVLAKAGLVHKVRQGKEQIVTIDPKALAAANYYLENYKLLWEKHLDSLDVYLQPDPQNGRPVPDKPA